MSRFGQFVPTLHLVVSKRFNAVAVLQAPIAIVKLIDTFFAINLEVLYEQSPADTCVTYFD